MAILKEFICKAHGPFEEFVNGEETPACPKGCSARWVTREIRTAPAMSNPVNRNRDAMLKDAAAQFGLTDIKVDKEPGTSVMDNLRQSDAVPTATTWGDASKLSMKDFKYNTPINKSDLPPVSPNIVGRHSGPLPEV